MEIIAADRTGEMSLTTGLGSLVLAGALPGLRTFEEAFPMADYPEEVIETLTVSVSEEGGEWETYYARYMRATKTLERSILVSSSTGQRINWGEGQRQIVITQVAGESLQRANALAEVDKVFARENLGVEHHEKLRVDAAGRVGIGTDTPVADLHVESAQGGAAWIGGVPGAGLFLYAAGAPSDARRAYLGTSGGTVFLRGETDDGLGVTAPGITLDMTSGEVGINGPPRAGDALYINGNIRAYGTITGKNSGQPTPGPGFWSLWCTGNSGQLRVVFGDGAVVTLADASSVASLAAQEELRREVQALREIVEEHAEKLGED